MKENIIFDVVEEFQISTLKFTSSLSVDKPETLRQFDKFREILEWVYEKAQQDLLSQK